MLCVLTALGAVAGVLYYRTMTAALPEQAAFVENTTGLELFDRRGYNWTIWNYKTTVTGWWTSSWGVYTCQMHLDTAAEERKCNVSTCTYEEFIAACELTRTEHCAKGTLWEVLGEYNR